MAKTATGQQLVDLARKHIGEAYVNRQVPKDDPNWRGPWDCAEFTSWLVYQATGTLYGCTDNTAKPSDADAYTGSWARDARTKGKLVSVDEAASTPGAFLLRYPPSPGKMGHIALSDGRGGTIEAKGRQWGVVADRVSGRRWDTGVLVPGIEYTSGTAVPVTPPAQIYRLGAANMVPDIVTRIQQALTARGFPTEVNGRFDEALQDVVASFQSAAGLVSDGEVGEQTAKDLGISLDPIVEAGVRIGTGALAALASANPLFGIALGLLPEVRRLLTGEGSERAQKEVQNAVAAAAGTSDPDSARRKLDADRTAANQLQVRLAEIVATREANERAAQKAAEDARQKDEAEKRAAEMKRFEADMRSQAEARAAATEWAKTGGPMAWGVSFVTVSVILGFFALLGLLVWNPRANLLDEANRGLFQLINIAVGALITAFTTVVSFYMGSSRGSQLKDVASIEERRETRSEVTEVARTAAREAVSQSVPQGSAPAPTAAVAPAKFSNFDRCVDIILAQEGGFTDNPKDPGGATNLGITLKTLKEYRDDNNLTAEDVKSLDRKEACEIYRTRYWNVLRCDDLPVGVDLMVFDFGVNAGPRRSARTLQEIVGAEADGSIGPATIGATQRARPSDVVARFSAARLDFYRGLRTWPDFGRGWTNRVKAVEQAASAMVSSGNRGA